MTAPKRLRRDAQDSVARLRAAALEIFRTNGLDASLYEIARAAGVSIGTLYHRFGTREGLIDAVIPEIADCRLQALRATVLGHEIAHATAHHGGERMSEAMVMQTGGSLLGAGLSKTDPKWQAAASTAYGLGTQVGRELPHSRAQESEADHIGLIYMSRAGYDPEEAVKFWQRFKEYSAQQGGDTTLSFLRTHPTDDVRIEQLKKWLPEAKAQK